MQKLAKNSIHTVTGGGYTAEGHCVCRIDGRVVFVPGLLREETAEVQILKVTERVAYARVVNLLSASPHRAVPDCAVFPKCGGCVLWHMDFEEESYFKTARVQDAITRIGGFSLTVSPIIKDKRTTRYRNKAQFPIAEENGLPVSGFFRQRSHTVIPTEDCLLQTTLANAVTKTVREWMTACRIPAYHEGTGKGVVRHVFVRSGEFGAVLCLICKTQPKYLDELVKAVRSTHPELTGVVLNLNPENTNVILGKTTRTVWGNPNVEDTLCGLRFSLAPEAFYQVNHDQAERLYQKALEYAALDDTMTALDLYCGAGTITLCLAKHAKEVLGIEVVPEAIENAKENAARNGMTNVTFRCADATEAAEELAKAETFPDVVVVDPPRKGLTPDGISAIATMRPHRIVYVSCDPATLARDLRILCDTAPYELIEVTPVDLFPKTHHVESVALLCRKE
ncbi:MAG: 23S rRNA (uracil(1939)-C(5))-methyltransferase RlmD [Oscillospiraceae bacterium]|nr:23S rRNA (uracil(1939)-C(5))-methyltransferase RlmD [Oscillospiraceae bacterium]